MLPLWCRISLFPQQSMPTHQFRFQKKHMTLKVSRNLQVLKHLFIVLVRPSCHWIEITVTNSRKWFRNRKFFFSLKPNRNITAGTVALFRTKARIGESGSSINQATPQMCGKYFWKLLEGCILQVPGEVEGPVLSWFFCSSAKWVFLATTYCREWVQSYHGCHFIVVWKIALWNLLLH